MALKCVFKTGHNENQGREGARRMREIRCKIRLIEATEGKFIDDKESYLKSLGQS